MTELEIQLIGKIESLELKLSSKEEDLKNSEEARKTLEFKIEALVNELLWLRRQIFGQKTERYIPEDSNQLKLDFEGLDILPEEQGLYVGFSSLLAIYYWCSGSFVSIKAVHLDSLIYCTY